MRLVISTPLKVVVDADDVQRFRGRDGTGSFGVLEGHADLVTELEPSVITWADARGEHFAAVRGGTLVVERGSQISISTREAVVSDELGSLEPQVVERMRARARAAEAASLSSRQLERALVRQALRALHGERPVPLVSLEVQER